MLLGMVTDGIIGCQTAITLELDEVEIETTDEYLLEIIIEDDSFLEIDVED